MGERIVERMCAACGRLWSVGFNFCPRDGTSLAMVDAFVEHHEAARAARAARPHRWDAARRHAQTRAFDGSSRRDPAALLATASHERPNTAPPSTRPTTRGSLASIGGDLLQ